MAAMDRNSTICFRNATIFDGTGRDAFTGSVLVEGNRIRQVGAIDDRRLSDNVEVIDATGRTLLPGLIMAHVHLSYNHVMDLPDLDLRQPPEVSTIAAVANARTMLECGWTAGLSAGALHRVD